MLPWEFFMVVSVFRWPHISPVNLNK
jgi:hypothetical protein